MGSLSSSRPNTKTTQKCFQKRITNENNNGKGNDIVNGNGNANINGNLNDNVNDVFAVSNFSGFSDFFLQCKEEKQ